MTKKSIFVLLIPIVLLAAACKKEAEQPEAQAPAPPAVSAENTQETMTPDAGQASREAPHTGADLVVLMPLNRALERITKKPFALFVTPQNSPVSPEIFTGYHTGVDFEAFANEAETDVVVKAICDGKLLQKRTATGYGGFAVQSCTIDGQAVTVVYGHLKLSSIAQEVGAELKRGDMIGVLGKGYSDETSNERKHLHLGIHKGSAVDIRGYVQKESELSGWINFQDLVK